MFDTPQNPPSLPRLQQYIAQNDYENAFGELLSILTHLDNQFGNIHGIEFSVPEQLENPNLGNEYHINFCTQMAEALTRLFTAPELVISDTGCVRLLTMQRWLGVIFAASPYVNADHILQTYNRNPEPQHPLDIQLENSRDALIKFAILYLPESNVQVNLDALWELDPTICISLCFALQSPRFLGTPAAFGKRHAILQWLPEKLAQLEHLNDIPSGITHDVYMHCSYDIDANKHAVKKSLNQVIRRHLLALGWQDLNSTPVTRNGKPVMLVVLEHFHSSHSIYRTHSTSIRAAREHFHIIGIGSERVDEAGRAVFDEFYTVQGDSIFERMQHIRMICEENPPAVLYMPSIGMDLLTIFLSNSRLAPVQAVALGHPATTHSEFIDYVVVEDDYVGSEDCFSETLLRLPKDALPYVPSSEAPEEVEFHLDGGPATVHIGVAATTMKLNPYFLEACRAIRDRAKVKVHFHFALGQSNGITHPYVARFIRSYLGSNATAYPHLPYVHYLNVLRGCNLMLNPFPFGNTNGIIDMVTLGLVGVCKTGNEVHEHIDQGLFARLGLPEWLVTHSADEYVECALRLIENHEERLTLRQHIIENDSLQTLFSGNPAPFGEVMRELADKYLQAEATQAAVETQDSVQEAAETPSSEATGESPAAEAAPAVKQTAAPKTVANKKKRRGKKSR